jgi:hypothetical protein
MDGLSFADLRRANVERCESAFHPLDAWSGLEWAGAAAGELGEAANLTKKLRRVEMGGGQFSSRGHDSEVTADDVGVELADTVIYLDLWAARLGIDLGAMVRAKFNATSRDIGSPVTIMRS